MPFGTMKGRRQAKLREHLAGNVSDAAKKDEGASEGNANQQKVGNRDYAERLANKAVAQESKGDAAESVADDMPKPERTRADDIAEEGFAEVMGKKAEAETPAEEAAPDEEPDTGADKPANAEARPKGENVDHLDVAIMAGANKAGPGEDEDRDLASLKAKYPRFYAMWEGLQEGGKTAEKIAKAVAFPAAGPAEAAAAAAKKPVGEAAGLADEIARASGTKDKVESFIRFLTGVGGKEDQIREAMLHATAPRES